MTNDRPTDRSADEQADEQTKNQSVPNHPSRDTEIKPKL